METNKIAGALVKAQAEMKTAKKDSENPFFKSKYADLGAVWEACHQALSSNGIAVVQAGGFVGEKFVLKTTLLHSSGESMTGEYLIKPTKEDPQGYGSAFTYARRYSLAAMVGVISEDDDGEGATDRREAKPQAASKPQPQTGGPGTISEGQGKRLYAIWKSAKVDDETVKSYIKEKYGFNSTREITRESYDDIIKWIEDFAAGVAQ